MEKNMIFRTERLKELRKNANMTQKEFSEKIGCTMASLSAYENGSKMPPTQTLVNIAKSFNCSIDWLFGLKNEKNYDIKEQPAKTYSEYIRRLFALYGTSIKFVLDCSCNGAGKNMDATKGIAFYDPIIKLFLKSWKKTLALYNDCTIDSTIYEAWKEKVLRDFNYNIITGDNSWEDFAIALDSYKQFGTESEYDAICWALADLYSPTYIPDFEISESQN